MRDTPTCRQPSGRGSSALWPRFTDEESDLLARVFATDIDNIKHTMELVHTEIFEAAVVEICRATGILVVDGGLLAPPAIFFAHSLKAAHPSHSSMPSLLLSPSGSRNRRWPHCAAWTLRTEKANSCWMSSHQAIT
jgi:hypothetical protein